MVIADGQPIDELNSNPAWVSANSNDTFTGTLNAASTDTADGTAITSIQTEHNSAASFMGKAPNTSKTDLPSWTSSIVGTGTDSLFARADALTQRFLGSNLGHNHDDSDGEGSAINAFDLISTRLTGRWVRAIDLTGITGTSTDVSTELTGKTPSTADNVLGIAVNAPNNRIFLRDFDRQEILDTNGNEIFGRLTEAAGVWTLTFFVDSGGSEVSHNFTSGQNIAWYYQQLFNSNSTDWPAYSELVNIPSDAATEYVIESTDTLKGKSRLSAVGELPGDIASTSNAGTASAGGPVANSDHTHKGAFTVKKSGSPDIHGTILLAEGTNLTLGQVGNTITINATTQITFKRGASAIGSGVKFLSIVFSVAFADANYTLNATLQNTSDTNPQFQPVVITAKADTGFTVTWSDDTDSANYILNWNAVKF